MASKDALKILALPHVHHPHLTRTVHALAGMRSMTREKAIDALETMRVPLGISDLDMEMCQPEAAVNLPFSPRANVQQNSFHEAVSRHLTVMLGLGHERP